MKKSFTKIDLEEIFRKIGGMLPRSVEVFLLGGGAMCFRNQKNATKDLDLVFKNREEFKEFANAITALGFVEPKRVENAYEEMKAAGIWEGRNGFRLDLFVSKVCGALSLSQDMAARSELLGNYGKLAVKMVSNEDVILFKGITERLDDADDIAAIIRSAAINWDIIVKECAAQSKARAWYGPLYNKLTEIQEKHGMTIPVTKQLQKLDKRAALREAYERRTGQGLTPAQAISELAKLGFKKKEIENAIK